MICFGGGGGSSGGNGDGPTSALELIIIINYWPRSLIFEIFPKKITILY